MKIVDPNFEIIEKIDRDIILTNIERIGRVCYKSEDKITQDSLKFLSDQYLNLGMNQSLNMKK
jgi:thymidylate synthase (FAD)